MKFTILAAVWIIFHTILCFGTGYWIGTESGVPHTILSNPPAGDSVGGYSGSQVSVERRLFPPAAPLAFNLTQRYLEAIEYAWDRESSRGTDPNWRIIGAAGEQGQLRQTPINIEDIYRISGEEIDPMDLERARYGMFIYLQEYAPKVEAESVEDLYELYRRGPTGYRRWKGN